MPIYVGLGKKREVFTSATEPTQRSHGHLYAATIGPFPTFTGAAFMAKHGQGNPHCQTVDDAERLGHAAEYERATASAEQSASHLEQDGAA